MPWGGWGRLAQVQISPIGRSRGSSTGRDRRDLPLGLGSGATGHRYEYRIATCGYATARWGDSPQVHIALMMGSADGQCGYLVTKVVPTALRTGCAPGCEGVAGTSCLHRWLPSSASAGQKVLNTDRRSEEADREETSSKNTCKCSLPRFYWPGFSGHTANRGPKPPLAAPDPPVEQRGGFVLKGGLRGHCAVAQLLRSEEAKNYRPSC